MKYKCGFAVVNNGRHLWSNGHCVVCPAKKIEVTVPPEPKPYDPKTYKLLSAADMILYNPNIISRRRKIISA